ncbi:ISCA2 [Symbiodinium sp. CCMP2592]|nr:ISCA2 [Symbiodinium sp. CCMP2592]
MTFLEECEIDYTEEMIRASFSVVKNKLADSKCGCGSSFSHLPLDGRVVAIAAIDLLSCLWPLLMLFVGAMGATAFVLFSSAVVIGGGPRLCWVLSGFPMILASPLSQDLASRGWFGSHCLEGFYAGVSSPFLHALWN